MDILLFNQRLLDYYGKHELSNKPRFRLVFSADEKEKRVIQIPGYSTYAEEVPKYPQIKPPKYILESLQSNSSPELVGIDSYEPLWVFGKDGDPNGEPIEPVWVALEFILNLVYNRTHKPYTTDEDGSLESRRAEADKLYSSLFGNETATGDALAHKEGIIVPRNFGD